MTVNVDDMRHFVREQARLEEDSSWILAPLSPRKRRIVQLIYLNGDGNSDDRWLKVAREFSISLARLKTLEDEAMRDLIRAARRAASDDLGPGDLDGELDATFAADKTERPSNE